MHEGEAHNHGSHDEWPPAPPGGLSRFTNVFWNGMHSAQRTCETAATLRWALLGTFGVPAERTRGPKEFNRRLVRRIFELTNDLAAKAVPGKGAAPRKPGAGTGRS